MYTDHTHEWDQATCWTAVPEAYYPRGSCCQNMHSKTVSLTVKSLLFEMFISVHTCLWCLSNWGSYYITLELWNTGNDHGVYSEQFTCVKVSDLMHLYYTVHQCSKQFWLKSFGNTFPLQGEQTSIEKISSTHNFSELVDLKFVYQNQYSSLKFVITRLMTDIYDKLCCQSNC